MVDTIVSDMDPERPAPKPRPSRLRRAGQITLLGLVGAIGLLGLFGAVVLVDGWEAIGKAPEGARREAMEASDQWDDGAFENAEPLWNDEMGMLTDGFDMSDHADPREPIDVVTVSPERFATPPESGLRVTWLGHSTLILEIDGHRFLADPVWGPTTAPVDWLGPTRYYPPPLALEDVPDVDAVLISHDHYDHLDHPTIVEIADWDTTFIVPLGVGAHLAYWGVPEERIVELDWWDRHTFGDLELVATPARHASGRQVLDQNRTLWAGFALIGTEHRAYYSGDTGLFTAMREIGERLGPFDVTMIEVGQYGRSWPDWHLGPEQAVYAHQLVRGDVLIPVHWGLFTLAMHSWTAPVERTLAEGQRLGVTVATPRPGESVDPEAEVAESRWWPDVPWRTAEQDPIVARGVDELQAARD